MKQLAILLVVTGMLFSCTDGATTETAANDTTVAATPDTISKATTDTTIKDIVITRTLNAPVETVWKMWTDPKQVMRWWGPINYTSPYAKIDLREGGEYVFGMRAPKEQGGMDMYSGGIFKKIIPNQLIEFTQRLCDKEGQPIDPVTLNMPADFPKEIPTSLVFKPEGNKTTITITEFGWKQGQMRNYSETGLTECIDKLEKLLQ